MCKESPFPALCWVWCLVIPEYEPKDPSPAEAVPSSVRFVSSMRCVLSRHRGLPYPPLLPAPLHPRLLGPLCMPSVAPCPDN